MVGLVLPRSGTAPAMRRLVIKDLPSVPFAEPNWKPDEWADGLCRVLPPDAGPPISRRGLPPGTDTDAPCR